MTGPRNDRTDPASTLQDAGIGTLVVHDAPEAVGLIAGAIREQMGSERGPVNVIAIGSDRTTGDCLGPFVGEMLADETRLSVFGTIEAPVHAANMGEIIPEITGFTIAVDAALGSPVGAVSVRGGSLAPGAAFGRDLPHVGDLSISGLMCETGPLGFERLRSVRLAFVRRVAHVIADSISLAVEMGPAAGTDRDEVLDLSRIERSGSRRRSQGAGRRA